MVRIRESGVSHGYVFDGKNYFEKDYGEEPTFAASGNGGVWSSVDELWKYEQAIQKNIFLDSDMDKKIKNDSDFSNWKDSTPCISSAFAGLLQKQVMKI